MESYFKVTDVNEAIYDTIEDSDKLQCLILDLSPDADLERVKGEKKMASTSEFSRTLSLLRKERGVSQRTAAGDLGISQALLSHYENGVREPGLSFVVKACDYYNVSADFILGRTLSREGSMLTSEEVLNAAEPGNILQGSVLATLQSKLLSGAVGVLFGLLGKLGDKAAINAAAGFRAAASCRCSSASAARCRPSWPRAPSRPTVTGR